MASSVAFLRGINVGRRRIKNHDLVATMEAIGVSGARVYQASGNVLFPPRPDPALESTLSQGLERELGYPVQVFVRSASEVEAIAKTTPFPEEVVAASKGKVQVTLLRSAPEPAAAQQALALSTEQDRIAVVGREWYWLPAHGISGTGLDMGAVEKLLGVGTTRTLGTMQRICRKL